MDCVSVNPALAVKRVNRCKMTDYNQARNPVRTADGLIASAP